MQGHTDTPPTRSFISLAWLGPLLAALAYGCALHFNGAGAQLVMLIPVTAAGLLWLGLLLWMDIRRSRAELPGGWVPLVMLLFFAWVQLTIIWSSYQYISLIAAWTVGMLPLWCLLWLKTPPTLLRWHAIWRVLLAIHIGLMLWGVIDDYATRAHGTQGPLLDSNLYGALMSLFLFPLMFRLLVLQRQQARPAVIWAHRLVIAFTVFQLFASLSLGARLSWLVLMLPAAVLMLRWTEDRRPGAGILVLVVLAAAGSWLETSTRESADKPNNPALFDAQQNSYVHRLYMIRSTWQIYMDSPVLGNGLGTYKLHYPAYRDPDETSTGGYHAHNDYLEFLQDGGPLLLLGLLLIGMAAAFPLLSGLRLALGRDGTKPASDGQLEQYGLALGVAALFLQASVNFIFYSLPHALIAGLFIGQIYRGRGISSVSIPLLLPTKPAKVTAILGIVLLLALPVWHLSMSALSAMVISGQSNLAFARWIRKDSTRHRDFTQLSARLQPRDLVPHSRLAGFNHELANDTSLSPILRQAYAYEARAHYLRILKASPRISPTYESLAELIQRFPQLASDMPDGISNDPLELLKTAIEINPTGISAYLELARLYRKRGEMETAQQTLMSAVRWCLIPVGSPKSKRIELLEMAIRHSQKLGRHEDAQRAAKTLRRLDPRNTAAAKQLDESSFEKQSYGKRD